MTSDLQLSTDPAARTHNEISQSLLLSVFGNLQPTGIKLHDYRQNKGDIKYIKSAFEIDVVNYFRTPFNFSTSLVPGLSKLINYEMSFYHGLKDRGWLDVFATYPFIFASTSLHSDRKPKEDPDWDVLSDITITHFHMVGGKTGFGKDVSGVVVLQESQPGVIIESAAYCNPSSILTGYSEEQLDYLRKQEDAAYAHILFERSSIYNTFIEDLSYFDNSKVSLGVVSGFSTTPFNNIDLIIQNIKEPAKKAPRKRKAII